MAVSIWNEIEKINREYDMGTTFELKVVDGRPMVRMAEYAQDCIAPEYPRGVSGKHELEGVPDDVQVTQFHDSQFLTATNWEYHLSGLLDDLKEFGGRVLFECQPISWDRDEDEDPDLLEQEPTILEGWALLVRDRVGFADL